MMNTFDAFPWIKAKEKKGQKNHLLVEVHLSRTWLHMIRNSAWNFRSRPTFYSLLFMGDVLILLIVNTLMEIFISLNFGQDGALAALIHLQLLDFSKDLDPKYRKFWAVSYYHSSGSCGYLFNFHGAKALAALATLGQSWAGTLHHRLRLIKEVPSAV